MNFDIERQKIWETLEEANFKLARELIRSCKETHKLNEKELEDLVKIYWKLSRCLVPFKHLTFTHDENYYYQTHLDWRH